MTVSLLTGTQDLGGREGAVTRPSLGGFPGAGVTPVPSGSFRDLRPSFAGYTQQAIDNSVLEEASESRHGQYF